MSGPLQTVIGWEVGAHHGLVWEGGCAVIDGSVPVASAVGVWARMRVGEDLWGFLQSLTDLCGGSLLQLPGFVVVMIDGGDAHAAARGPFEVVAVAGEDGLRCDGEGVTTWTERRLGSVDEVTLSATDAVAEGSQGGVDDRPVVAGVVPAGRLTWITGLAHRGAHLADPGIVVPEPESLLGPESSPAPESPDLPPISVSMPVATPTSPDIPAPEPSAVAELAELEVESVDSGAVAPPDRPETVPVSGRFAQLFGEDTIMGSVQEAAVQASEPAAHEIVTAAHAIPQHHGTAHDEPEDALGLADHDGQTIIGVRPDGSPRVGALEAILCLAGHANPSGRDRCRACGGAMGTQRTTLLADVPVGWVQASSGPSLELTGTIIVGRRPMAARVEGLRMPALLTLPFSHISGSHLEIRVEGWEVYATDLNSTNGTFLHRGQEPPRRITTQALRLAAGDVLDLGHGVRLTFPDMP